MTCVAAIVRQAIRRSMTRLMKWRESYNGETAADADPELGAQLPELERGRRRDGRTIRLIRGVLQVQVHPRLTPNCMTLHAFNS